MHLPLIHTDNTDPFINVHQLGRIAFWGKQSNIIDCLKQFQIRCIPPEFFDRG